jgi:hypothetical protein
VLAPDGGEIEFFFAHFRPASASLAESETADVASDVAEKWGPLGTAQVGPLFFAVKH